MMRVALDRAEVVQSASVRALFAAREQQYPRANQGMRRRNPQELDDQDGVITSRKNGVI